MIRSRSMMIVQHGTEVMAKITVTVPDKIAIGRNAEHGTLPITWASVPQNVLDHIAGVYFPQYITDRANSGGKASSSTERVELAKQKLEAMYAGTIRARGTAEPADPVEAEAYRLARPVIITRLMSTPEAKQVPKGTKDRAQWILDARDAAAGREPREVQDLVAALVESDPAYRKEAKRNVEARAKLGGGDLGIEI